MLHVILNSNSHLVLKNWKAFILELILTLKQHEEFSKKKQRYFDPESNESYIPYVIETSIGLDRMFLTLII